MLTRLLSTILLVAIAVAAAALGLSAVSNRSSEPAKRAQLAEAIDGGAMQQYLENSDQKNILLDWIENGAPEEEWDVVAPILEESCVLCHDGETEPYVVPLNQYPLVARVSTARSLLAEKAEWGTMTQYFEDPGEKEVVLRWIESGAPQSGWPQIEPIMMERCVSCHNPESGVQGLVSLDIYATTARSAEPPPPPPRTGAAVGASIGGFLIAAGGLYFTWRKKASS